MSNPTTTTGDVRETFASVYAAEAEHQGGEYDLPFWRAVFDAWHVEVIRAAKIKALNDAATELYETRTTPPDRNDEAIEYLLMVEGDLHGERRNDER